VAELEPFAFDVDESDHCETPGVAYKHIAQLLREIAQAKFPQEPWRIASKKLQIYDPYFCQGGVKTRLSRLGFECVHNENEDFYKVCEADRVPDFDVLLTNPPFSADEHFSFALDFAMKSGKPWFMILPVHVIFRNLFTPTRELPFRPFFLAPQKKYNFKTPAPLPPPPKENRAKARSRSRLTHTLWTVHGGENEALHQRLLEVAHEKVSDLCHVARNVAELPKVALPGDWTEEMRVNAEREGLDAE